MENPTKLFSVQLYKYQDNATMQPVFAGDSVANAVEIIDKHQGRVAWPDHYVFGAMGSTVLKGGAVQKLVTPEDWQLLVPFDAGEEVEILEVFRLAYLFVDYMDSLRANNKGLWYTVTGGGEGLDEVIARDVLAICELKDNAKPYLFELLNNGKFQRIFGDVGPDSAIMQRHLGNL